MRVSAAGEGAEAFETFEFASEVSSACSSLLVSCVKRKMSLFCKKQAMNQHAAHIMQVRMLASSQPASLQGS